MLLPRSRFGWLITVSALSGVLWVTGCIQEHLGPVDSEDPSTQKVLTDVAELKTPACQQCALFVDDRPLWAAVPHPDSMDFLTEVGNFLLRGEPGATVVLTLAVDDAVWKVVGPDQRLYLDIGETRREFTFRELEAGATVYVFDEAGEVELTYTMNRRISERPNAAVSLTQTVNRVQVLEARTPWVPDEPSTGTFSIIAESNLLASQSARCLVQGPGEYCGVEVRIYPYFTGGRLGGFQSRPGTGYQVPITITFSEPVREVTVTIIDPDFLQNSMEAYDTHGNMLDIKRFSGDYLPGHRTYDTQTVSGAGIVRVVLRPDPKDFVAYRDLSFGTEELELTLTLDVDSFSPVLARCFNAVTQVAQILLNGRCRNNLEHATRSDTTRGLVTVTRGGVPDTGALVTLLTSPVDSSGGHFHGFDGQGDAARRPSGRFRSGENWDTLITATTDSLGVASFVFRTSGISGTEIVIARLDSSSGGTLPPLAVEARDSVLIQFPGLLVAMPMNHDSLYSFKCQDYRHGVRDGNTYAQPYARDTLLAIFTTYFADTALAQHFVNQGTTTLNCNDGVNVWDRFVIAAGSIRQGGLFDEDGPTWNNPHQFHRTGEDFDLRRDNIPVAARTVFEMYCRDKGARCALEADHYHVYVDRDRRSAENWGQQ